MSRKKLSISGLYAITPDCTDTVDLLHRVRLALVGGARVLQYRDKSANATLRLNRAHALHELADEFAAVFIINDDVQLALQVDADGVHLGATDDDIESARTTLGKHKIIGVSCYNRLARARYAVHAGADYLAFGAFFPSDVKPTAATADVALLQQARTELELPLVAIGGINLSNGAALVHAGADSLAVITALFNAPDITLAAQNFSKLFAATLFTQDLTS